MNTSPAVLVDVDGAVATIKMNVADRRNVLNPVLRQGLSDAFDAALTNDSVRCVVLAANGTVFGAGQDFAAVEDFNILAADLINVHYKPLLLKIHNSPKPVIAAVNGLCVGMSASLALACDLLIMDENAELSFSFSKFGLAPDGGASWHLVNLLGAKRAFQILAESKAISAQQALQLGIANKVYQGESLLVAACEWAEQIATVAPLSLRFAKAAVRKATDLDLADAISMEAELQQICSESSETKAAMAAFLTRKK
ncbi:enoyl-CoA hydratase/isomerase family protein [Zhongshania aliphaticivorans]|uniref:enoyl-CoA hydratase/isomerase family protein n=1 Tax=Zhongshania aliphaticivorans TaxID=1470434 RepID=UPI0012E5176F|nr:enoyl-CoA hydratase/isomerase family protein [Zhongshania aliphaticivorans]CAA0101400.1 Short-chain-enoyl-CoA hydratase [Zhongshania aliphaticivorans]